MAEAKGEVFRGLAATDSQSECVQGHLLRSKGSLSPNRQLQVENKSRDMAIKEGKVKGQRNTQQDQEMMKRSSIQSNLNRPERSDIHLNKRTAMNDFKRSRYNFQSIRQKFEVMSQSVPIKPVDYTMLPGQRGRPTERKSNYIPYRSRGSSGDGYRSHSASGVRSAPHSPVCSSRSVLNLSDPSPNHLTCTYSAYPRRFSHSSTILSANNSSSSLSFLSDLAQTSTTASQRLLLPETAAVTCISKQFVPKSDHSKTCEVGFPSHMLKTTDHSSPVCRKSISSSQYSVSDSEPLLQSDIHPLKSGNTSTSSHNLDQWLQSVVSAKNMNTLVEDRDRTPRKNRRFSSSHPSPSEQWTQSKTQEDRQDDKDSRIVSEGTTRGDSVHTRYESTSGKYSDTEHYVMSRVSPSSSFHTIDSPHKDPPVTICITQDPDDEERDYLNLSASTFHKDLSTHRSLSPRSSFGSVCSVKSSNADSAVDMNNPDDDSDHQCKVSPTQTPTPLTTHSLTSLTHSLASLVTHPGIPVSGASPVCSTMSKDVPQVVVSDHSVHTTSDSVQLTKSGDSLNAEDMDHISRPWSPEDSAYSGNSDLSLDDTEDEEPPPPPKKKVRTFYHSEILWYG